MLRSSAGSLRRAGVERSGCWPVMKYAKLVMQSWAAIFETAIVGWIVRSRCWSVSSAFTVSNQGCVGALSLVCRRRCVSVCGLSLGPARQEYGTERSCHGWSTVIKPRCQRTAALGSRTLRIRVLCPVCLPIFGECQQVCGCVDWSITHAPRKTCSPQDGAQLARHAMLMLKQESRRRADLAAYSFVQYPDLDLAIIARRDNDFLIISALVLIRSRRPNNMIHLKDIMGILRLRDNHPFSQGI